MYSQKKGAQRVDIISLKQLKHSNSICILNNKPKKILSGGNNGPQRFLTLFTWAKTDTSNRGENQLHVRMS